MPKKAKKKKAERKQNGNGANLGFEAKLWAAADKLRGNMEPSDYKHVALGLIFLKYISDAFEAKREALLKEDLADPEDPEEYLAENVFWVPKEARWSHLQANAKQASIGKLIDDAMLAIEAKNESLKGVLPKEYARPALNKVMLGELIDLISGIAMNEQADRSKDILGRVYEYFLGGFAGAEGKRGGEFYTPRSVVQLLVEMLEPYKGRVYDPCCGSGGMFVQSEKFVEEHGGRLGDIAIYGQESNYTTWRLAKMNLAVRGIDADIRWNNEGSFHKDELKDLKVDYILANPPFNISMPTSWRAGPVGDCFDLTMGQSPPGNTYNDDEEGLPFFQGRTDFGFRYPENRKFCSAPTRVAEKDDALVSVRAPVGDINMAWERCCIGRGVAALRHKSGSRSFTYYSAWALQQRLKEYEHTGTVFGAINKKQFEALSVIEPTPEAILLFEQHVGSLDERVRCNTAESRTIVKTRDLLLPKLMSGEVRIREAEEMVEAVA